MTLPAKHAFLGGLPRSGSTLISAILRQNPAIDVTPTGFLIGMVQGMQQQYSASQTRKSWLDQTEARERFRQAVAGAVGGYLSRGELSVEKSRGVLGHYKILHDATGDAPRIIFPVRDLRGVLGSMERLTLENPEQVGFDGGASHIRQRIGHWLSPQVAPLGTVMVQLADAVRSGLIRECLVLRYEDLLADPAAQMARIYRFLGYEYPGQLHDFANVQDAPREHDAVHGPFGDHVIKLGAVDNTPPDWRRWLDPETAAGVVRGNGWFYRAFYPEVLRNEQQEGGGKKIAGPEKTTP